MNTIWERVNDRVLTNWRHPYKAMLLLDYLLKNGTEQVINDARVHMSSLQSLTHYQYIEGSNDVGVSSLCLFSPLLLHSHKKKKKS